MANQQTDWMKIVTSNHPARPYLILGGLIGGIGLFRSSLGGLLMAGLGAALIKRGVDEVNHVQALHDGNFHGHNGPPANR